MSFVGWIKWAENSAGKRHSPVKNREKVPVEESQKYSEEELDIFLSYILCHLSGVRWSVKVACTVNLL